MEVVCSLSCLGFDSTMLMYKFYYIYNIVMTPGLFTSSCNGLLPYIREESPQTMNHLQIIEIEHNFKSTQKLLLD